MRRAYDAESTQAGFDERLARLAAAQHGVFARTQAASVGATRGMILHRLRMGRWDRLSSNVFRLSGSPSSWQQTLMAACLGWGVGAIVSHRAAAALWRLAGFDQGPVELTVPRGRRRAGPGIIHRHPLGAADVTRVEGILVTTPARTLIDLASVVTYEAVEEAMDDALRRGLVSIPLLRRRLAALERRGRPGVGATRDLLDVRDPSTAVPESIFERRLLRVLERAGLPSPVPQHEIHDGERRVAIVDFAYPEARLAIEADGYRWHDGRVRWDHGLRRRNRLTVLGWRIIHVTWTDLTRRPNALIEAVRKALAAER